MPHEPPRPPAANHGADAMANSACAACTVPCPALGLALTVKLTATLPVCNAWLYVGLKPSWEQLQHEHASRGESVASLGQRMHDAGTNLAWASQ